MNLETEKKLIDRFIGKTEVPLKKIDDYLVKIFKVRYVRNVEVI